MQYLAGGELQIGPHAGTGRYRLAHVDGPEKFVVPVESRQGFIGLEVACVVDGVDSGALEGGDLAQRMYFLGEQRFGDARAEVLLVKRVEWNYLGRHALILLLLFCVFSMARS